MEVNLFALFTDTVVISAMGMIDAWVTVPDAEAVLGEEFSAVMA